MWLQDNRTFFGEKCVEFLLQRQTWFERVYAPLQRDPVFHRALNN